MTIADDDAEAPGAAAAAAPENERPTRTMPQTKEPRARAGCTGGTPPRLRRRSGLRDLLGDRAKALPGAPEPRARQVGRMLRPVARTVVRGGARRGSGCARRRAARRAVGCCCVGGARPSPPVRGARAVRETATSRRPLRWAGCSETSFRRHPALATPRRRLLTGARPFPDAAASHRLRWSASARVRACDDLPSHALSVSSRGACPRAHRARAPREASLGARAPGALRVRARVRAARRPWCSRRAAGAFAREGAARAQLRHARGERVSIFPSK